MNRSSIKNGKGKCKSFINLFYSKPSQCWNNIFTTYFKSVATLRQKKRKNYKKLQELDYNSYNSLYLPHKTSK